MTSSTRSIIADLSPVKLIAISRPRFWGYTAGPYFLGTIIGAPTLLALLEPLTILNFLYFLVPANLLIYGVNDYFDQETDRVNPKKAGKEVLVSNTEVRVLPPIIIGLSFLSVLMVILQTDLVASLLMILFLFLSLGYSAPPLRFKAKPMLDSLSNSLYFLPGFLAYYYQAGELPELGWWLLAVSWAAAMHLYSAVPDIEYDRRALIRTSAVMLGQRLSLVVCTLLWAVFAGLVLIKVGVNLVTWLVIIYPILPLISLIQPSWSVEKLYWWFPKITMTLGTIATWWVMGSRGWWY